MFYSLLKPHCSVLRQYSHAVCTLTPCVLPTTIKIPARLGLDALTIATLPQSHRHPLLRAYRVRIYIYCVMSKILTRRLTLESTVAPTSGKYTDRHQVG